MRESRTYGSGRGACHEMHVPTATAPRVHHAARRCGGAWPLAARAQQPTMPVIGFLRNSLPVGSGHLLSALRQGLNDGGYVEARMH